jgi:hypothetical protein
MLGKIVKFAKGLGRKAVGYIRGLNGDKAAAYTTAALANWNLPAAAAASPFIKELGQYINQRLDEWSDNPNNPTQRLIERTRRLRQKRPRSRSSENVYAKAAEPSRVFEDRNITMPSVAAPIVTPPTPGDFKSQTLYSE